MKSTNFSFLATKSVSAFTSTTTAQPGWHRIDHAFGCNAAGLLAGGGKALLTQDLDGLGKIAVGWVSAFLHSIMPQVGLTAQFHNVPSQK